MKVTRSARIYATLAILALIPVLSGCQAVQATAPLSPNAISSADLVEQPKVNDGDVIEFTGEAIGEAMVRGTDAWLHINDDAYYLKNAEEGSGLHGYNSGMPVFLPAELARQVEMFGDYKHEGDVVTVSGTFNATCAQHGGDTDIHADSLERVIPGHRVIDQPRPWKVVLAAGLSLLVLVLWQIERMVPPAWEREQSDPRSPYRKAKLRKR